MANTVEQTTFKYSIDQNSINAVERAAAELEGALNSARGELAQYGSTSKQAMTRVEGAIDAGTRALREQAAAIDRVEQGYDDAAKAAKRASGAGGGIGGGATAGAIDRVGSIGSQIASGLGQGEVANLLGLVGDLSGGFDALGTTILPLTILTTGASAAINFYNQRIEENRKIVEKAANARLGVQDQYFQALLDGATSSDVEEMAAGLERTNEVLKKQKQELVYSIQQSLAAGADVTDFNARLAELGDQIGTNAALIDRYNYGLAVGTFAENDRIRAEEEAAEASAQWMDRRFQNELSFRQRVDGMDAAARGERIQDIEREIDLLKAMSLEEGITEAQRQQVVESELLLRQERQLLLEVNHTTADSEKAIAAARELTEARTDAYLDALKRVGEAQEALTELKSAFDEAAAASADKIAQIRNDLGAKETELGIKYAEDLAKIETDGGKERERIAKEFSRRRTDIEDQMKDAIAARDTVAYLQAQEQQQKIAQEEQDANDELEARLKEQRDTLKASYDKQLADARAAADKSIQQEQARWNAERQTRQNAINQAQADLFNALNSERLTRQTFYAQQAVEAQNAYVNLANMAFQAGQSLVAAFDAGVQLALFTHGTGGSGGATGGGVLPSPLGADYIPRTGGAAYTAMGATSGGSSLTVPITVHGTSKRQVVEMVDQRLDAALTQAGWAA